MSGQALISQKTAAELKVVTKFFGIDMEWDSHIFRHAAQVDARAFEATIRAMAEAVQQDLRYGATGRIRERNAKEKSKK